MDKIEIKKITDNPTTLRDYKVIINGKEINPIDIKIEMSPDDFNRVIIKTIAEVKDLEINGLSKNNKTK